MNAYIAFCKKEFTESIRMFKSIIMLAVFIFLGILSPLTAKLIPDILNGTNLGGISITLPPPTAMDSWTQFFGNIGQMGVLVLVIVFCGITANELNKGTLINILTKGMKRHTIILSKYTAATVILLVSYCLSLAVTYAYTVYLWGSEELPHAFLAFVCPFIFGLFLLSLMILGGILFKSYLGSLLSVGGVILVLSLINISPKLQQFNPISLSAGTLALLNGQKTPDDFIPALIICLALIIALTVTSVTVFNRRQL